MLAEVGPLLPAISARRRASNQKLAAVMEHARLVERKNAELRAELAVARRERKQWEDIAAERAARIVMLELRLKG